MVLNDRLMFTLNELIRLFLELQLIFSNAILTLYDRHEDLINVSPK